MKFRVHILVSKTSVFLLPVNITVSRVRQFGEDPYRSDW